MVAAQSQKVPIRICIDSEDYPPYFFETSSEGSQGMILDLIRMSVEHTEHSIEFTRKPWRRCLSDVKSGYVDASGPVIWSKARSLWAQFPTDNLNQVMPESALVSVQYRVFTRSDSALRWNGTHFSGIRYGVGAPIGHISHKRLKAMGILPASSFTVEEGLTMVSRGFLDGFVNESLSGQSLINQLDIASNVSVLSPPFLSTELYLVFSHQFVADNPEVPDEVYQALALKGGLWREQLLKAYVSQASGPE
ncbi:MAG: hypothetical protein ACRBBW_02025 [Cellvibrionaceae bacterium]